MSPQEGEFLIQSNAIEGEYSMEATTDAGVAWKYLTSLSKLTTNDIRIAHKLLMIRLRPDIAGKWRNCEVYIGGIRKDNLGPVVFESQVDELLRWIHAGTKHNKKEFAQNCHVMFEEIHPFEDGNGRVGRMLYNWQRLKLGLDLHVIHTGTEQKEYYGWFRKGDGKF